MLIQREYWARRGGVVLLAWLGGSSALLGCSADTAGKSEELRWLDARVRFLDSQATNDVLGERDQFVAALSAFDRGLRLETTEPVTTEDYLRHVAQQGRAWDETERERWVKAAARLSQALAGLALPLPEEVGLARTTGAEEFDSAHTRGTTIVIPAGTVLVDRLQLLAHELFHVATRHEPSFRARLSPLIGFESFERLLFPPDLEARRVTNPDAPFLDASIRVSTAAGEREMVPILQSKLDLAEALASPVPLGSVDVALVELDPESRELVANSEGMVTALDIADTDYELRASVNTGYILHPEEILADNFALLVLRRAGDEVEVERPELLDAIEAELSP